MTARARERATYADVVNAPEQFIAELIEGELYLSPRPRIRHALAASVLLARLMNVFQFESDGWWFLFEPELHFGDDILVPDIAGCRRHRLAAPPDTPWIGLAPDWICEVISGTGRLDRVEKLPVYAREGVPHAWLSDPEQKSLEVFRLIDGVWSLVGVCGRDERVHAEPFDTFELDLTELWGPETSPPPP